MGVDAPENQNIEQSSDIDIVELFYRLLENLKTIILVAVLGAILMGVYSCCVVTPMYEATSKIYILASRESVVNLSDLQIGNYLASDYVEIFKTHEVQEQVIETEKLNYSVDYMKKHVSVTNLSNTRILSITFSDPDRETARRVADTYAELGSEYINSIMLTDKPTVLSAAVLPSKPVSPNVPRNVILGFLLGALLVIIIVAIRFITDDKIKTSADVRKYLDLPTLAILPINSLDADIFKKGRRDEKGKGGN